MELARIIELVDGESHAMIRRKWLTKLFVMGDMFSFTLQAAGKYPHKYPHFKGQVRSITLTRFPTGGGIMSSGNLASLKMGEKIVVAGLLVQILFFGFFVVVALSFHIAMHKVPTQKAQLRHQTWRKHLYALYVASIFIMVRSIFRVVEYVQGNNGYLLRHEYYLYIFDSVLMLAVMVVFNLVHPSEVKAMLRGGKMAKGFRLYSLKEQNVSSGSDSARFYALEQN